MVKSEATTRDMMEDSSSSALRKRSVDSPAVGVRLRDWLTKGFGASELRCFSTAQAEHKQDYERLLESFRSDQECDIMTLGEMTEWWKVRKEARIQMNDNKVSIISPERSDMSSELQPQLVTGYGGDGFNVVNI